MYAVEFRTKVKDGFIELPKRFKGSITDTVKVIVMSEYAFPPKLSENDRSDIIQSLLTSPLEIKEFHPLQRDDIYAR